MSQQRQKDLEEILGLWYKKLAFFEKKLPLVDGLQQELVIQEEIKKSNSKISQYETEYWDIMTQDAIFVFDNDEQEAEESLQDITVAVQQVEATNLSPEVVEVVKEIRDRLNTPKEPASAKLKATLPLIPSILSYEIELNTSQIIHKVLEKVRQKKILNPQNPDNKT